MSAHSDNKDSPLIRGLSSSGKISSGNLGFYATWLALAVILAVFLISAFYIVRNYRETERNTVAQSAELLAETVDARLSTTSEAVSRFSFSIFHTSDWKNSSKSLPLARRLMESRPEIVEISVLDSSARSVISFASGFAFEALSLPPGKRVSTPGTLEMIQSAHESDTALFSNPYVAQSSGIPCIDLIVPASDNKETVLARISLTAFMHQVTPSSLTDKAMLSLKVGGQNFLTTSPVEQTADESFNILLPPLPASVTLSVTPYRQPLFFMKNISLMSITGLSTALLIALFGLGVFQIRQRRTARRLLAESLIRRAMSESMVAGLRVTDLQGRIVYVNRAFRELFRIGDRDVLGERPPYSYWPESEYGRYGALPCNAPKSRDTVQFECQVVRRDGTEFASVIEVSPLSDDSGQQLGWLEMISDVTEQKKTEERIAQQEKKAELSSRLITMGEMASSLAHELNQPLGAITNYSSAAMTLLQMNKLSAEDCMTAFGKMSRQAERAAAIIKRIRSFAKRTAPEMVPTPVQKLIDETMELALIQAKKRRATITLQVPEDIPDVVCDAVMIEQLLLNLLKNAMEAAEPCPDHEIRLTVTLTGERTVSFAVSDRGPGVPEDIRDKLFEPFFSTKTEGMGIGLNICRSIAEMHRGRLRIEDNPGGGAVMRLTLPAAPAKEA